MGRRHRPHRRDLRRWSRLPSHAALLGLLIDPVYRYAASLVRLKDGDTYVLDVDLGFYVHTHVDVRLHGVNTPEITGPSKSDGLAAKAYVQSLFDGASVVTVQTYHDLHSFERWVADVWLDGVSLADTIIQSGHGVALDAKSAITQGGRHP